MSNCDISQHEQNSLKCTNSGCPSPWYGKYIELTESIEEFPHVCTDFCTGLSKEGPFCTFKLLMKSMKEVHDELTIKLKE